MSTSVVYREGEKSKGIMIIETNSVRMGPPIGHYLNCGDVGNVLQFIQRRIAP